MSGKTVALSGSPTGSVTINPATAVSDSQGRAVFTVADANAESVTFSASDTTDSVPITQTAMVQFQVPAPSATASTVDAKQARWSLTVRRRTSSRSRSWTNSPTLSRARRFRPN